MPAKTFSSTALPPLSSERCTKKRVYYGRLLAEDILTMIRESPWPIDAKRQLHLEGNAGLLYLECCCRERKTSEYAQKQWHQRSGEKMLHVDNDDYREQ